MEIGWSELLVIGVVALIVVGPKDLPEMFRTLGRITAKMRAMAREFSRAMEDAARESGVDEVAKDLRKATSARSMGLDAVKSATDKFERWDPLKSTRKGMETADDDAMPGNSVTGNPPSAEDEALADAADSAANIADHGPDSTAPVADDPGAPDASAEEEKAR